MLDWGCSLRGIGRVLPHHAEAEDDAEDDADRCVHGNNEEQQRQPVAPHPVFARYWEPTPPLVRAGTHQSMSSMMNAVSSPSVRLTPSTPHREALGRRVLMLLNLHQEGPHEWGGRGMMKITDAIHHFCRQKSPFKSDKTGQCEVRQPPTEGVPPLQLFDLVQHGLLHRQDISEDVTKRLLDRRIPCPTARLAAYGLLSFDSIYEKSVTSDGRDQQDTLGSWVPNTRG